MQTIETIEGWQQVITDLASKRQAAQDHAERLRGEKRGLALEAVMGSAEAKKRLDKINNDLGRFEREAEDWDAAIARAEGEKQKASEIATAKAEEARQAELRKLAAVAFQHAREFDTAAHKAAEAGAKVKAALQAIEQSTRPDERQGFAQFVGPPFIGCGSYYTALQRAGFPALVDMPHGAGHSLEEQTAGALAAWLPAKPKGKG